MIGVKQELEQYFEIPNMDKEAFERGVGVGLGCDASRNGQRCGGEVVKVILFDIKPETSVTGEPNNIPINLCQDCLGTDEFDHMFYKEGNVVPDSIRQIGVQDYVEGEFDKARPYSRIL